MSKSPRKARSDSDYLESEEHFKFLREKLGLNEEQLESLSIQIGEQCAPSLNTQRKRILRFMRAILLYERECLGFIRAVDRFNKMIGEDGTTPFPVIEEKRRKALKKSGLDAYQDRQHKIRVRSFLPSAPEFVGGDKEKGWERLIKEISWGSVPWSEQIIQELLKWGVLLKQVYNPRRNKPK